MIVQIGQAVIAVPAAGVAELPNSERLFAEALELERVLFGLFHVGVRSE